MKLLGQNVFFRRAGREKNMKMRVHQHKRMGREIRFELNITEGLTEKTPALGHLGGPPGPLTQSGVQMKKSQIVLKSSGL